jgi:hypothetical protein
MIIGSWLPLQDLYTAFKADKFIIDEANEIVKSGAANGRSAEEKYDCSIRGLALQYALISYLEANADGEIILAPRDALHWDFSFNGILIDVKGAWGRYFSQSAWEQQEINRLHAQVLYLCVACFPEDKFQFKGGCWSQDLAPSQYGGQYVQTFYDVSALIPLKVLQSV